MLRLCVHKIEEALFVSILVAKTYPNVVHCIDMSKAKIRRHCARKERT